MEVGAVLKWVQHDRRACVRKVSGLSQTFSVEGEQFVLDLLRVTVSEIISVQSAQAGEHLVGAETAPDASANLWTLVVDPPADVFGHEVDENFPRRLLEKRLNLFKVESAPPRRIDEDERERTAPACVNEFDDVRN